MLKRLSTWVAPCYVAGAIAGAVLVHGSSVEARDWKWLPSMICQSTNVDYEPGRPNSGSGITGKVLDVDSEVVCPIERDIWSATPMFLRVYLKGSVQCQLWVCHEQGTFGQGGCYTESKSKTLVDWGSLEFLDNWTRPVKDSVSVSCQLGLMDEIGAIYVWEN